MDNKLKLIFAPGCFDNFEGTQEELDQLIAEIQKGFESGELLKNSKPLDADKLLEEDPELAAKLFASLEDIEQSAEDRKRKLN